MIAKTLEAGRRERKAAGAHTGRLPPVKLGSMTVTKTITIAPITGTLTNFLRNLAPTMLAEQNTPKVRQKFGLRPAHTSEPKLNAKFQARA